MSITPNLVSIIIPAYDVADIVGRAIRSALTQTYNNLEVLVVDDASRDATAAAVAELAAQDRRIRLLGCESNLGPGAARNVALAAARGEWIALLDADDAYRPERLQILLDIAAQGALDVVADNLILVDPGLLREVGHGFPLRSDERFSLDPRKFAANSVPGGRVMLGWMKPLIRHRFLVDRNVAWRPLRHGEDFLFVMELLLRGAKAELVGWPGYYYTRRRGNHAGQTSPHSRTQRSAVDQKKVVEILLAEYGDSLAPGVRQLLCARVPEITATEAVLDLLAALRENHLAAAVRHGVAAVASPAGLARCMRARFGPRARHLVT